MKAIILASGKGLRFMPLSLTKPKPLTRFFGKTILEHNLEALSGVVDEVYIAIGYMGEKIQETIGDKYKSIKINYVWDKKIQGTGATAKLVSKEINEDKIIIMNGDDIYNKKDIEKIVKKFPCILLQKVSNPKEFGIIETEEGKVSHIQEKPEDPKSDLANQKEESMKLQII